MKNKRWSQEEKDFLRKNYNNKSVFELSKILDRTENSISQFASRNKIKLSEEEKAKRSSITMHKTREAMGGMYGEDNPNWKSGISKNNYHYKKLQKERFPEKIRARELVNKALKSGKLIRCDCEECGDHNSFAHHEDYNKPLDVVWLCRKHHRERHC